MASQPADAQSSPAVAAGQLVADSVPQLTPHEERVIKRERDKRRMAATASILQGLREQGDYSLPGQFGSNEVLKAGFVVEADGSTYRKVRMPQNYVRLLGCLAKVTTLNVKRPPLLGWTTLDFQFFCFITAH